MSTNPIAGARLLPKAKGVLRPPRVLRMKRNKKGKSVRNPYLTATVGILTVLTLTGCSAAAHPSASTPTAMKSAVANSTPRTTSQASSAPATPLWPTRGTGAAPASWTPNKTGVLTYAVPTGWVLNNPNPVNWHSTTNDENLTVWTTAIFAPPAQNLSVAGASSAAIGVQPAPDGATVNARIEIEAASGTYSMLLVATNDATGQKEINDLVSSLSVS